MIARPLFMLEIQCRLVTMSKCLPTMVCSKSSSLPDVVIQTK